MRHLRALRAVRSCVGTLALALALLLGAGRADARKFLDAVGDADRAILDDLHNGRVIEAYPFGQNGNTGHLWKVKIEHNGNVRWAVFKPRDFGDRDGWARTPMEVAMYKLNRILGMDLVAPAAYRRNLNLNGTTFGEGALILWVDDAHKAWNVPEREWNPRREAFSSDLRILQAIGRDADNQNGNNIMRGRHWKDGRYRVIKVDNEACGRQGAYVDLEHQHPEWGAVTRFNRETYDRLRELNFNDLKGDLGEFISDDEIRGWLGTRDHLVRTIDARARNGNVWMSREEIAFDTRLRLGKAATPQEVAKLTAILAKKGVRVELVAPGDPGLQGAYGRAVLTPKEIVVRLAKVKSGAPTTAAIVEELVHANQLLSMAKRAGGLAALHAQLKGRGKTARAARLSMEEYAKGKVLLTSAPAERPRVERARVQLHERAARTAGRADTRDLWRTLGAQAR